MSSKYWSGTIGVKKVGSVPSESRLFHEQVALKKPSGNQLVEILSRQRRDRVGVIESHRHPAAEGRVEIGEPCRLGAPT